MLEGVATFFAGFGFSDEKYVVISGVGVTFVFVACSLFNICRRDPPRGLGDDLMEGCDGKDFGAEGLIGRIESTSFGNFEIGVNCFI